MGWIRDARATVREDLDAAMLRDPAAETRIDVAVNSPGLHAIWAYRGLHRLWQKPAARPAARALSTLVRSVTGVEIHPGAQIGRRFFIDHGMGVVIGATAVVGDDVMLYHGVTLGGRTLARGTKRHPTVGDRVTIGARARPVHLSLGREAAGHRRGGRGRPVRPERAEQPALLNTCARDLEGLGGIQ